MRQQKLTFHCTCQQKQAIEIPKAYFSLYLSAKNKLSKLFEPQPSPSLGPAPERQLRPSIKRHAPWRLVWPLQGFSTGRKFIILFTNPFHLLLFHISPPVRGWCAAELSLDAPPTPLFCETVSHFHFKPSLEDPIASCFVRQYHTFASSKYPPSRLSKNAPIHKRNILKSDIKNRPRRNEKSSAPGRAPPTPCFA